MVLKSRTFKSLIVLTAGCLGIFYIAVCTIKWDTKVIISVIKDECPWQPEGTHINQLTNAAVTWQLQQNTNELWNTTLSQDEREDLLKVTKEETRKLVFIFTTWRSGSTFLGDLLNSHPAVFYNYEPMAFLSQANTSNTPNKEEAEFKLLENLSHCNYTMFEKSKMSKEFPKMIIWSEKYNKRLWTHCNHCNVSLCTDAGFMSSICQVFPFHVTKIIRLRLSTAESLLNDDRKAVKIIHLVRDPRAVWASKAELPENWCRVVKNCRDPEYLCSGQVEDYHSYKNLKEQFPERVFLVRFEELALSPEYQSRQLFKNLGLSFHPQVKNFIQTHTHKKKGDAHSTFRNSSTVAYGWESYFKDKPAELRYIEDVCEEAMQLWGYSRHTLSSVITTPGTKSI